MIDPTPPQGNLLDTFDDAGYKCLPGLRFASNAVAALPNHHLCNVVFAEPLLLDQGFERIERYFEKIGLPLSAIAGLEVQMGTSLSLDEFREFNSRYLERLSAWNLLRADGSARVARTNVAPRSYSASDATVAAFSYAAAGVNGHSDYIVSGVAEVPDGGDYPDAIVRRGESSRDALTEKMRCVMDSVNQRISAIGTDLRPTDDIHVYSMHDVSYVLVHRVLDELGLFPRYGVTWHDASPPAHELALEIDVRRFTRKGILATNEE